MLAKLTHTVDDVKKHYEHYCTVGQLLEFIKEHNLPNDSKILIQRIEDIYFEKHSWGTVKKEGFIYAVEMEIINKAKSGVYSDKKQYPLMNKKTLKRILNSEKTIDNCKEEYVPVFSPIKYKDDDNLYLDAHY